MCISPYTIGLALVNMAITVKISFKRSFLFTQCCFDSTLKSPKVYSNQYKASSLDTEHRWKPIPPNLQTDFESLCSYVFQNDSFPPSTTSPCSPLLCLSASHWRHYSSFLLLPNRLTQLRPTYSVKTAPLYWKICGRDKRRRRNRVQWWRWLGNQIHGRASKGTGSLCSAYWSARNVAGLLGIGVNSSWDTVSGRHCNAPTYI